MNNQAGQAISLTQLGSLYSTCLNRQEEAATFYRQATDLYVELEDLRFEGVICNNIADTLRKLERYDEARSEIMRAIECQPFGTAVELWKSFNILHDIELATGNPAAAYTVWQQACDAYLTYRQQGGYAQSGGGKLVDHVLGLLAQEQGDDFESLFNQLLQNPDEPDSFKQLIQAVVTILNGSRDPTLADDPALNSADAAEILFLLDRLGGQERDRE